MMLYSPGYRSGLIKILSNIELELSDEEAYLHDLIESVLIKLEKISDREFDQLDLYKRLEDKILY